MAETSLQWTDFLKFNGVHHGEDSLYDEQFFSGIQNQKGVSKMQRLDIFKNQTTFENDYQSVLLKYISLTSTSSCVIIDCTVFLHVKQTLWPSLILKSIVLVIDSVTVAVMTEPKITPINIQQIPNVLPITLRGVTSPYLTIEKWKGSMVKNQIIHESRFHILKTER